MALGQWRKCHFCHRRFRLVGKKGIIATRYNYLILQNKNSDEFTYLHRKCWQHFEKTRSTEEVLKLRAGFNIKQGLFFEGELEIK